MNDYTAMDWYCVIQGKRLGPVPWTVLMGLAHEGKLRPEDLVWCEVFGDSWRPAGRVRELFAAESPSGMSLSPLASGGTFGGEPPKQREFVAAPVYSTPLTDVPGQEPGVRQAAGVAGRRMRAMLFRPFDLPRWFSLGFCAWLAMTGGGCQTGPNWRQVQSRIETGEAPLAVLSDQFQMLLDSHPLLTAGLSMAYLGSILIGLALAVFFCWLRARGSLMVLHRLHVPSAGIGESWRVAGLSSTPLFWWRLGLGVTCGLILLGILVGAVGSVGLSVVRQRSWTAIMAAVTPMWLAVWCGMFGSVAFMWMLLSSLGYHFLEPVMYWRRVGVRDAWAVLGDFWRQYPGALVRFCLCLPVWRFLLAGALMLFVGFTCCLGLVLLLLPFIGAVVLLPFTLFHRGLGRDFLASWRPDLPPRGSG